MKVKGIIRNNTVQLSEAIIIPDGTEVTVEISDDSLSSAKDQWQQLQQVAGAWQDDPQIDEINARRSKSLDELTALTEELDLYEDN